MAIELTPRSNLPRLALAADLLAAVLLLLSTIALLTRGISWEYGWLHLTVRAPGRPFLLALLVLAVRHSLVPFPHAATPLMRAGSSPLPMDERALFTRPSWRESTLAALGLVAVTLAFTWPQASAMYSVPDLGDPLFSIWRLSWVSHQLPLHPLHLFDGNQFYPERYTLTYSDAMLVPSLMAAPLLWLGVHQVFTYNFLFLASFVLSGLAMFVLVRALAGRGDAAFVAAVIFTLYPYRFEHYSHLELQMTMWMPLAVLALHRTMARGTWRDGLWLGLLYSLQALSSLYYGLFLAAYLAALGLALWLARGGPRNPVKALVAAGVVSAVLIAPVATAYIASNPVRGDRDFAAIQAYSATGSDYLTAHPRSRTYQSLSADAQPERALFPRLTPVALSAVALWPPLSAARIGYALTLALTVDGSFGLNGQIYPILHTFVPPFRGLRVPARFSMPLGLTLAILSGYAAARLFNRWPRLVPQMAAGILLAVTIEAIPLIRLVPVWRSPPAIYGSLSRTEPAVLAEFPMAEVAGDGRDARYLYFSTFHWQTLVNGESGFFPLSYVKMLEAERDFPSARAIDALRTRGVQYVSVHGAFYGESRYRDVIARLDARPDFELVASAPWEGSESRLYRFTGGVA